ncbi:MAG: hypothetical protein BGP16_18240 [Sphingobium sp. 66-54]|nr:MAG: hypothetical protein BGP16_18240 [Sphingobium sp. 66-54]
MDDNFLNQLQSDIASLDAAAKQSVISRIIVRLLGETRNFQRGGEDYHVSLDGPDLLRLAILLECGAAQLQDFLRTFDERLEQSYARLSECDTREKQENHRNNEVVSRAEGMISGSGWTFIGEQHQQAISSIEMDRFSSRSDIYLCKLILSSGRLDWVQLSHLLIGIELPDANEFFERIRYDVAVIRGGSHNLNMVPLWQDLDKPLVAQRRENFIGRAAATSAFDDWLRNSLAGNNFRFQSDDQEVQDRIYERLVHQEDSWWGRPVVMISREIDEWLSELDQEVSERDFDQNPRALTFDVNANGLIDLQLEQNTDGHDAEAEQRFMLVQAALADATAECDPARVQANDVIGTLQSYGQFLGDNYTDIKAVAVVLYGNKLRRQIELRDDPTELAAPFSAQQSVSLRTLLDAHNILVAMDANLLAIE